MTKKETDRLDQLELRVESKIWADNTKVKLDSMGSQADTVIRILECFVGFLAGVLVTVIMMSSQIC